MKDPTMNLKKQNQEKERRHMASKPTRPIIYLVIIDKKARYVKQTGDQLYHYLQQLLPEDGDKKIILSYRLCPNYVKEALILAAVNTDPRDVNEHLVMLSAQKLAALLATRDYRETNPVLKSMCNQRYSQPVYHAIMDQYSFDITGEVTHDG
jgi:hypothetical protein